MVAMIPSPLPQDLKTGILHLGLGAFHRAHQAAYTQDAIVKAGGDWGIEAVSMRNPALSQTLNAQNGRYTLIERHPGGPRLIDMTVIRAAHALPGNAALVASRMADPAIRIITITVTEKGYGTLTGQQKLDRADPAITHDLANAEDPQSLVGLLCLGLSLRRKAGHGGLTIISCDNLPENGQLLRAIVDEFARETDPTLATWITEFCRFPSSMVDRITPSSTNDTFALAHQALGHSDPAAVETEPFRQWVIEDNFAGPRPAWQAASALIVPDVTPFETMKLRLLNGAHSMIAYLGALAGLPYVRDVMANADLRALIRHHMSDAATTLSPLPGYDPESYADALIDRFANPAIDHRCLQIAMDGSQKLPQRIFAPARDRLDRDRSTQSFALAVAAWIRFAEGRDDAGQPLNLDDPLADEIRAALASAVASAKDKVNAIANLGALADHGMLAVPEFRAEVARHLDRLSHDGILSAVRAALSQR